MHQWGSRGQHLKTKALLAIKAKARTFEAETIGAAEATAFKHTAIEEIKICRTSDSLTGQVVNWILAVFFLQTNDVSIWDIFFVYIFFAYLLMDVTTFFYYLDGNDENTVSYVAFTDMTDIYSIFTYSLFTYWWT